MQFLSRNVTDKEILEQLKSVGKINAWGKLQMYAKAFTVLVYINLFSAAVLIFVLATNSPHTDKIIPIFSSVLVGSVSAVAGFIKGREFAKD